MAIVTEKFKRAKNRLGLGLVNFGLWIYEGNFFEEWTEEDHANYKKLLEYRADFSSKLVKP